jgi:hypothetical protein
VCKLTTSKSVQGPQGLQNHRQTESNNQRDVLELIEGEKESWDVELGETKKVNENEKCEHNIT